MKFKSLFKTTLAFTAALTLAACGNSTSSSSSSSNANVATEVTEDTTITFWHAMTGAQEDALKKFAEDFQAANPKIKIELQNQGKYSDLQAKINATVTSPKDLPTITQAYPAWLLNAVDGDLLVDLKPYVENSKIGYTSSDAVRSELMTGAQINGVQYGIPFNKSTEVLWYNKDLFTKYGVSVPTTMEELKTVAQTIYEKSNHEVVGAGFDSLNNYYAIGLKNEGIDFNKDLDITSATSKSIIDFYGDGIKAGYFRTAGSDKYLSGPFTNQKVAMYIGSSAGEGFVSKGAAGKFEYGVAARPTKVNIQQGTDIYMFNQATANQRTAAFLFMKYLTSADVQLYWAEKTGYMPVVQSVLDSDAFKNSSSTKVPSILADATKQLFSVPVVPNGDSAYKEIQKILESIYAQPEQEDSLLKAGQTSLQSVWNQ